ILPQLKDSHQLTTDATSLVNLSLLYGGVQTQSERITLTQRIDSRITSLKQQVDQLAVDGLEADMVAQLRNLHIQLALGSQSLNETVEARIAAQNSPIENSPTDSADPQQQRQVRELASRERDLMLEQDFVSSQLTGLTTLLIAEQEQRLRDQEAQVAHLTRQTQWGQLILIGLGTASVMVTHHIFRRRIIDRVLGLHHALADWQLNGHWQPVPQSEDELGQMGQSLNRLLAMVEAHTSHLTRQVGIDPLTGLANRWLFWEHLQEALAQAQQAQHELALMFVDLDKFKPINDTYGHDVGDVLLTLVAQRMTSSLARTDTLCRIGGDEFVILLPKIGSSQMAQKVAHRVGQLFQDPFQVGEHSLHITVSIGIALFPEHGQTAQDLLRNADLAMYNIKHQGGNGIRIFDATILSAKDAGQDSASDPLGLPQEGAETFLPFCGETLQPVLTPARNRPCRIA
ncbi:MAG: GGDEF domain-containing protein, partial [Synechococcaceae cyanobacterium RM1_1_27]|nr:GGDEF domain-containing protein [Synechococcaceae cyanobacterium RM1_1_27]